MTDGEAAWGRTRGHPTRWNTETGRFETTDGQPVDDAVPFGGLRCVECGRPPSREGHDACIANLPGVRYACCGHGDPLGSPGVAYVTLDDGTYLRAREALDFFREHGRQVPDGLPPSDNRGSVGAA